jgi:dipeptidyl aminopeptidase/acylaminoacyl peptidase
MSKRKKIKKIHKTLLRPQNLLYATITALLIILVWWLASLYYVNHKGSEGSSALTQTTAQYDYRNLNISLAKKANFASPTITQEKTTGTAHSVKHIIFNFAVPHDNLLEKGLMTLPTTPPPSGGYPVLILCHGYVNPWNYSTERSYLPDMEFYSRQGFAVIKPDFRGQGLSINAGQPEGAYYSMAYNTDVMSLIGAIKSTNYLDHANINIWGHSMGAYIALRATVISPDIRNAILLAGPVGDISDMFSSYVAISDTANPTAANIRLKQLDAHGSPISNPDYWKTVSPLTYISGSKTHYQIHVGSLDTVVPPKFSKDFDDALTKAQKPHEYYVYANSGHGLLDQRTLIYQRSLAVLKPSS